MDPFDAVPVEAEVKGDQDSLIITYVPKREDSRL